jgi:hypothetical protein
MLRADSLFLSFFLFLLVASITAVPFCSGQNVRVPVPAGIAQSQDLHAGVARPNAAANGLGEMPAAPTDDVQRQQAIAADRQRQIEIRRDTDKMLALMVELKDELQKADHVLSLDAVKKAEQIEKLAHSVKSKMKSSF